MKSKIGDKKIIFWSPQPTVPGRGVIFGRRRRPKIFLPPLGRPFFTKSPPRWKNFGQFLLINYPPGKKIFDHPPFPGAGPGGKFFGRRRRPKNFYPPTLRGCTPPLPSVTLPMYVNDPNLPGGPLSKNQSQQNQCNSNGNKFSLSAMSWKNLRKKIWICNAHVWVHLKGT